MAEQNFTSGHCFDCLLRCAEMSTFDRRQEKNMQSQTLQNTDEHKSGLFVYLFLFYPLFASKTFQKIILIRKRITQSFQLPTTTELSFPYENGESIFGFYFGRVCRQRWGSGTQCLVIKTHSNNKGCESWST